MMDSWNPAEWPLAGEALIALLVIVVGYSLWRAAQEDFRSASTRTVAYAVVLAAIAAALGQFSLPVGAARVAPAQHMVNIMAAVILGPWWATLVAFVAAIIRNATQAGTPLAFPGGMIGALLAGLAWRASGKIWIAAVGEIVGTGLLAALVSALLVAPVIMARSVPATAFLLSFLGSTLLGTAIGVVALQQLRRAGAVDFYAEK